MMPKPPVIDVPVLNLEVPAIAELAARDQWVCWKYAPAKNGEGKLTKVPIQANGLGASSTNAKTWVSLSAAIQGAFAGGYGVGFVFSGDGIIGIDLDGARNKKTGRAEPWAVEALQRFKSYTELSPSGTGFHIFVKGKLPEGVNGRKGAAVEIYAADRYFTMTGIMAQGSPETIEERQEAIDWFLAKFFKPKIDATVAISGVARGEFPFEKFDALMTMDNRFRATWLHKRGDLKDQSLSTYDMALCVRAALVDWTDAELAALIYKHRVDKWHDASGKADRQDYIDRTISYARSGAAQHSDGGEKIERAEAVAIARTAADDVAQQGPEASLVELRTRLGIPVKRAIITGIDRALSYAMELEDGRVIEIGTTAALLDQRRFRCAVAETTKDVLPMVKQPVWDGTVKVFLNAAEHVEPGDEDPRIAMDEAVDRFFDHEKPCPWDDDSAEIVFSSGGSMIRDGRRMLTLRRFCRWLHGEGYEWKEADARKALKACGFAADRPTKRIEGKVRGRNFWVECSPCSPPVAQQDFEGGLHN
jgi:hypothetical protein